MAPAKAGVSKASSPPPAEAPVEAAATPPPEATESAAPPEATAEARAAAAELPPARGALETPVAFATPESALPGRDDSSYPPVDLDSHFFSGPDRVSDPHVETEERDPRMALKLAPSTARRRAQLARYVKVAVGLSSALCLAALVKVAVAHNGEADRGTHRPAAVAVQAPLTPLQEPPPAATTAEPTKPAEPRPPATTAAAEPTRPATTAAAQTSPPPAETAAPAPAPSPATTEAAPQAAATAADTAPAASPDPVQAGKEKKASQTALERGKVGDSIEAGERSVALDPTDGEAWLILGAAYQQKGDMTNARRCYRACLEQGKRGPKYECAQMPH